MSNINSKRRLWRRSVALGIIIALAVLLSTALAVAGEVTSLAAVIKVSGEVQWQSREAELWTDVQAGQVLDSGDRLRTAAGGSVAVMFLDDRSLLKLAEKTDVTFHATEEGGTVAKRIWMDAGQLWAKVTKAESPHFRVETPTSVAAVKGSEFYDIEEEGRGNILFALSGRYAYGNEHGEVELLGGRTGRSDGNSPPSSRATRPEELPGFGGGLRAYGGQDKVIRVELIDEEGREQVLVIPLTWPEDRE
jgi:ferric-dicitrate binding protein FerR (iron transport regulator)